MQISFFDTEESFFYCTLQIYFSKWYKGPGTQYQGIVMCKDTEGGKARNMVILTACFNSISPDRKKQESILHALYSCQVTRIPAPPREAYV